MSRSEHIAWCKGRALELLDGGDSRQAVLSMLSDLRKHDETRDHPGALPGVLMIQGGRFAQPEELRNWIEGFN